MAIVLRLALTLIRETIGGGVGGGGGGGAVGGGDGVGGGRCGGGLDELGGGVDDFGGDGALDFEEPGGVRGTDFVALVGVGPFHLILGEGCSAFVLKKFGEKNAKVFGKPFQSDFLKVEKWEKTLG